MKMKEEILQHVELGDFLEMLRCSIQVDGKCLTIHEVCNRASMSTTTYQSIKRALI